MAAAYAALVSLMHIIDKIQLHPRPPISLDKQQVQSLTQKIIYLQEFLEDYSHVGYSKEADALESRIADAANAAEDIIESHIVDQILAGSTNYGEKISIDFFQELQKVIEDIDLINKEVLEIKEENEDPDQLHRVPMRAASLRPPSTAPRTMVDFGEVLNEIMDKLTGGQPYRQTISIIGMGGIGKTTLARNIYENQVVVQHFHILAWGTISQEYSTREILLEILVCLKSKGSREYLSQMDEDKLGETLYKSLSGWTYLIVLDDIWDIEVWDKIKFFFPENNNGSRIMLTTRLSKLAFQLSEDSHVFAMHFLNEDKSWKLFCKHVFSEENAPLN